MLFSFSFSFYKVVYCLQLVVENVNTENFLKVKLSQTRYNIYKGKKFLQDLSPDIYTHVKIVGVCC